MEEIEISIKNKEAELSGLKLECTEQAKNLTDILIQVDTAKKDLIDIDTKKKEFDEYIASETSKLKVKNDEINAEKANLVSLKETSSNELKRIKDDTKVANRELSIANDSVLKAKDELEEITKKKDVILLDIAKLNLLVEELPKLKEKVLELEEKRDKLKSEISEMLDSSTEELRKAKEELVRITKEVEIKVQEANDAEYRCKKYVDELYTHMNDYQIVKDRLESVYKTKFPELDLKI